MTYDNSDLLQTIGTPAYHKAPKGWAVIIINVFGLGASVDIESYSTAGETDQESDFLLRKSAILACSYLRKAMHRPGSGSWYLATITIDRSGHLEADFDYESQPFDDDEFDDAWRQVMENEQRLFPRDAEHLPEWFTSRMAETPVKG